MSSSWNFERVPLFARFFFFCLDGWRITCLLYRLCFENSRTCPWTRIYEQPRSFQAYVARAGAWPFLSPFLPFAATVDRFFFPARPFHRAKQGVSNTDFNRGQTIHSTFHRFMSIFMSELYLFSLYVLRNLFSSLIVYNIIPTTLITFTKNLLPEILKMIIFINIKMNTIVNR